MTIEVKNKSLNFRKFLSHGDGIVFEPEIDSSLFESKQEEHSYFAGKSEQRVDEMVNLMNGDDGGESEVPGQFDFEAKAERMHDLTPDGGVKKRV